MKAHREVIEGEVAGTTTTYSGSGSPSYKMTIDLDDGTTETYSFLDDCGATLIVQEMAEDGDLGWIKVDTATNTIVDVAMAGSGSAYDFGGRPECLRVE